MNLIPESTYRSMLEKADTLFENGYRIELWLVGLLRVHSPEGKRYIIRMDGMQCDCPCWQRYGQCKHERGAVLLVQRQMSDYYRRLRATKDKAEGDRLDQCAWELECALSDLTGGEFFMPDVLKGLVTA